MARIRTIKPELFRHEELYELEVKTGLPIRIAWIGLFTVADREGRFRWQPRVLKLDVLPFDKADFEMVLEALKASGFIKQYSANGKLYGYIPSFNIHQRVKSDEAQSQLPTPPDEPERDRTPTVVQPEPDRVRIGVVELELERELEKEKNISAKPTFDFDRVYREYPRKEGKQEGIKHCRSQIKTSDAYEQLLLAVRRYRDKCQLDGTETKFMKHFSSFMAGGKWRDFLDPDVGTSIAGVDQPFSIARILASKGESDESGTVRSADSETG